MRIKWLAGAIIGMGMVSCAHMGGMEETEKVYGKNPPVIEKSFASNQLRPGDLWKIYIRASDPDGDMDSIVSVVEQTGMGSYPASSARIKGENGKEISGYIYLSTSSQFGLDFLYNQELTVSVQIKDKAGHISRPVSFKVLFSNRQGPTSPPAGVFKEVDLGPIMVTLKPPGGRKM